jgi:hypothetical protein
MESEPLATKTNVVTPLFGRSRIEDEPEIRSQRAAVSVKRATAPVASSGLDLTSKQKVLFLNGLGGTGKTMLARWLGWRMTERGDSALIAALDPQNRSLADWFAGVEQPETSAPNQTQRFLRDVLGYLTGNKQSGLLDFGGGDVSLAKLIDLMPTMAEDMVAAGVHPVAVYCLSSRVDDLTPLQTMEELGFRPEATMLVLNEGRVDSSQTREEAFARILRHSDVRAAIARGAVPVWMPRLEPDVAAMIEARRLTFGMARDGLVPTGAKFAPIGGFERSMVRRWLERMEQEFAAVSSWLL